MRGSRPRAGVGEGGGREGGRGGWVGKGSCGRQIRPHAGDATSRPHSLAPSHRVLPELRPEPGPPGAIGKGCRIPVAKCSSTGGYLCRSNPGLTPMFARTPSHSRPDRPRLCATRRKGGRGRRGGMGREREERQFTSNKGGGDNSLVEAFRFGAKQGGGRG